VATPSNSGISPRPANQTVMSPVNNTMYQGFNHPSKFSMQNQKGAIQNNIIP
jgi:hypothetical protein